MELVLQSVCSEDSECVEEERIRFGIEKEFLNKSENHKRTRKSFELFVLNVSCMFKGRFIMSDAFFLLCSVTGDVPAPYTDLFFFFFNFLN